jgi:hypothetical protein
VVARQRHQVSRLASLHARVPVRPRGGHVVVQQRGLARQERLLRGT